MGKSGAQGQEPVRGPRPVIEKDREKRAAIVGAVTRLETASDALFQDRQDPRAWEGFEWEHELWEAHRLIRRVIEARRTRLERQGDRG